jgi:hypothetical protein
VTRRQFGRIRKLPSGRWQARYPDGLGRDLPAPDTFATKSDASAFLAKVQTEMERGAWLDRPSAEPPSPTGPGSG